MPTAARPSCSPLTFHEIEVVADDLVVIGNGRIVADGTKAELLTRAGTHVRTRHPDQLTAALAIAGVNYTETGLPSTVDQRADSGPGRALRVEADPELVGHIAHQADVALIELRDAEGAGLEEMFLQLTADTQREHHPSRPGAHTGETDSQEDAAA